jgi:hypothetical protein
MISDLRTPAVLLEKVELPSPNPILPWIYPGFDSLLAARDKIRYLELTPIKTDEDQAHYKTFSRPVLGKEIIRVLGKSDFLFLKNRFPYLLPDDVEQYILWINKRVSEQAIDDKLTSLIEKYGDAILFERSMITTTPLSRGTIKSVRHIHFWCRNNKSHG